MKSEYIVPEIEVVEYLSEEMIAASPTPPGGGNENHGEEGQGNSTGSEVGGTGDNTDFDMGAKGGGGFTSWASWDDDDEF